MINLKKRTAIQTDTPEVASGKFQEAFFPALSDVILSQDLEKSLTSIVTGIRRAFGGDVFLFKRSGEFASLIRFASDRTEEITNQLSKAGVRISPGNVPLSGGRAKVFDLPFAEYEDPFNFIGDMTSAAACRKVKGELDIQWIVTLSSKTESAEYGLLLLLRAKPVTLRQDLGRFGMLLKVAHYLLDLKGKLHGLETKFDEQFIKLKKDLRDKEGSHLFLFNEMPVAAAVLDDRGVISESNESLRRLVGTETNPAGKSFSSLLDESERTDFIEFMMNVAPGKDEVKPVRLAGRDFKAYVVSRKKDDGERGISVVYLADTTSEMELQRELGRTIEALRADNEAADRLVEEMRRYSAEIVSASSLPVILVKGGTITLASRPASELLQAKTGQPFREFLTQNGIVRLAEDDNLTEITDSGKRSLSVSRWRSGDDLLMAFADVTESKRLETELRDSKLESDRLFNSFLATAAVRGEAIVRWNDMFASLFKDFVSTGTSLDSFIRYLGESPEAFKAELRSVGVVMKMCRTTDRKYVNVSATSSGEMAYLFLEDITEQENLKQLLRGSQGLLSSSLESFSKEPIFISDGGIVRAANVAARNMLSIRLDEPVDASKILSGMGITGRDEIGELGGDFFRVETTSIGNSAVYRFRLVNVEVEQRAEIEKLKRRQEVLRSLSASDRYEAIIQTLSELLQNDGVIDAKVVGTGTVQTAKEIGDVFLLTTSSGKVEPSLSLSIGESDTAALRQGGLLSKVDVPDTTFMNVISAGDSSLMLQSTLVGDVFGFASVAIERTAASQSYLDEIGKILKAASSIAAGLQARKSVERKFEDSGKVTRALVGLTGIGSGRSDDSVRRSIDLLRQIFGAESVGVYSIEGPSMSLKSSNGSLPEILSLPGTRFGSLAPVDQLESAEMKTADGFYFAMKSRPQKTSILFRFAGTTPAVSELTAVSSLTLDLLESWKSSEEQEKVSAQLLDNSKSMSEFMGRLASAQAADDVVKLLGDSLKAKSEGSSVTLGQDAEPGRIGSPMELVEMEGGDTASYAADFKNLGVGVLKVSCASDPLSRTMVELAVDKIRSMFALKLPSAQSEIASLRSRLDRSKEEFNKLRESVDRIPASLRNARIEIDNVLSRLSYVVGDDKIMREIRLHLASAAKEMSVDLDYSSRNQDELFESVRAAVVESIGPGKKIRRFDTSALAEFRADQAAFDLLKDLFVNFASMSGSNDCDILLMTAQPSPNEAAEGKGKHVSMRLTGGENEILHDSGIKGSPSILSLTSKLEKLGYAIDTRALGNEVTLDICEFKPPSESAGEMMSALLVEDDAKLLEEESQILLQIFSRLRVAGDAVEAAKIFEEEKFNAAFIDLSLPSINGRELCRQIKNLQPSCATALLTNREGEEKSEGVDEIVLRPLEEETIRKLVRA